ncbi:MAG: type II toxin-antitoxin system RelE/ParE family toxin [Cytophagales bacterium]|nr:type II toxin-antitoxin system RelE/ParE family toxin [Cytophagales bacterium]
MAKFYFTSRAIHDLIEIEESSILRWGENQTKHYMKDMYESFKKIAQIPEIGRLRRDRTYPFFLAPVKQHYAVFHPIDQGIIIATVLHGRRDIERIVSNLSDRLSYEIEDLLSKL